MPLHLLGKKSWNVYNADNVAKVRRDEAEAKLREEAEERRMQEEDAERRLNILRGSVQDRKSDFNESKTTERSSDLPPPDRRSKKRKLQGEDDTDRDIRLARLGFDDSQTPRATKPRSSNADLVDSSGHIDLFPQERTRAEKNDEHEMEAFKKRREYEDQYTMRFSNATGEKGSIQKPWYSTTSERPKEVSSTDVWGNEDPRRQAREEFRKDLNDPLAAIKKGVKQLKEAEKGREAWKAQRDRETAIPESSHSRRHRRQRDDSPNQSTSDRQGSRSTGHRQHRHDHHHHSRRDRERSRSREKSDHSRRRRHRPRSGDET